MVVYIKWALLLFTTFLSIVSGLLLFAVALVSLFASSVWVYVCSGVVSAVFVDFLIFLSSLFSCMGRAA